MDTFFTQSTCDRCGGSLKEGRITSMFNTDCICMECKRKEQERDDYETARNAENEQIKAGNYNFSGIGLKGKEK